MTGLATALPAHLAFVGDWLNRILDEAAGLSPAWLAALAFALAAGETALFADVIVPGEVGLVLVGAATARGDMPLVPVVAAAVIGAIVGDTVSYTLGKKAGLPLVRRWEWLRRRVEPSIERGQEFFERHGGVAVFGARWVGALRAVMPFVAGMSSMPFRRFFGWNVLASIGWATTVVVAGFVFGEEVADLVERYGSWISVAAVVALAGFLAWRWLHRDSGEPSERVGASATSDSADG